MGAIIALWWRAHHTALVAALLTQVPLEILLGPPLPAVILILPIMTIIMSIFNPTLIVFIATIVPITTMGNSQQRGC